MTAGADWGHGTRSAPSRRNGARALPVCATHSGHAARSRSHPGHWRAPDAGAAPRGSRRPRRVSIDYYTRLERGKETRPSPAVVDALARALKLDPDEHEHLRALAARAARFAPEPPAAPGRGVRPQLKLLLETLRPNPAYITSRTLDLLAWNPGALALYAGIDEWPASQRNIGRFLFLHPAARDIYADWDNQIRGCVARMRALAGTDPDAPDLAGLVGELLLKSPEFARLWERYDVTRRSSGQKRLFTIPMSERSPLPFRACSSKALLVSAWASTSPNRAPLTTTPWSCWT